MKFLLKFDEILIKISHRSCRSAEVAATEEHYRAELEAARAQRAEAEAQRAELEAPPTAPFLKLAVEVSSSQSRSEKR